MKKKTINIPIYNGRLTLILDKDLSYIEKTYKTKSLDDYGAVTLKNLSEYRHYVIAFTDAEHLSNIVHEIIHLKNYIYLDCGVELDRINDESEAYFCGWLFDQIFNFITKNK